jgi:hypothetical protein
VIATERVCKVNTSGWTIREKANDGMDAPRRHRACVAG